MIVWQPLERQLPRAGRGPHPGATERIGLGLVAHQRVVASTESASGSVSPVVTGEPYDASYGGQDVRATALPVESTQGRAGRRSMPPTRCPLLDSAVRSSQLKVLDPAGGGVPAGGAPGGVCRGQDLAGADRAVGAVAQAAAARQRPRERRRAVRAERGDRSHVDRALQPGGRAGGRARPGQADAAALRRDAGCHPRPGCAGGRGAGYRRAGHQGGRRAAVAVRPREGLGHRARPHRHGAGVAHRPADRGVGGDGAGRPGAGRDGAPAGDPPARDPDRADRARGRAAGAGDGGRPGRRVLRQRRRRDAVRAGRAGRGRDRERAPAPGGRAAGGDRCADRSGQPPPVLRRARPRARARPAVRAGDGA